MYVCALLLGQRRVLDPPERELGMVVSLLFLFFSFLRCKFLRLTCGEIMLLVWGRNSECLKPLAGFFLPVKVWVSLMVSVNILPSCLVKTSEILLIPVQGVSPP